MSGLEDGRGRSAWITVALRRTGAVLLPALAILVALFVRERACFDRYSLLPVTAAVPPAAYAVAALYLAAHVWIVAVYAVGVRRSGQLLPSFGALRAACGGSRLPAAFLAVFGIEYVPARVWQVAAHALGLCG